MTTAAPSGEGFLRAHPELPIFRLPVDGARELLYAPPGRFTVASAADVAALARAWRGAATGPARIAGLDAWCRASGREAAARWEALAREPFAPECLTVALGRSCGLRCGYCFVRREEEGGAGGEAVHWPAIEAAAELVGATCRARGKPLDLLVHGGGEPTCEWPRLVQLHAVATEAAERHGLELRATIATNGLLEPDQARWLGARFARVHLSCDGPPDLQDAQRPRAGGGATSAVVARTAALVKAGGARLVVRATITPAALARQEEVARFLCGALGAEELAFEPRYTLDGEPAAFAPDDAEPFAHHLAAAQAAAASLGVELSFAGVRLDELHGPHCDAARQVLRLVPDGRALACFAEAGRESPAAPARVVGGLDGTTGRYRIDGAALARLRGHALSVPEGCRDCVALLHCSRGCPEACHLVPGSGPGTAFRCRLHRALTRRWLEAAAARADGPPARPDEAVRLLPPPPWRRYGYAQEGRAARERLLAEPRPDPSAPISVYLHVPFCDRRCGFCDCLSERRRPADQEAYLRAQLRELEAWGRLPWVRQAPVTTIHLGGGTPACLPPGGLARLVEALRETFGVGPATELALESTVERSGPADLEALGALGFSRLHLGVQTFADPLRRRLGRRHTGEAARQAVQRAVQAGWITSVDLLYGLPGQPPGALLGSIEAAVAAGAHGVSLYRFNASPRNAAFVRRSGRGRRDPAGDPAHDLAADLASYAAGEALLLGAGYRKNHLAHYALPADRNLYSTHAARGEDLVALGPTADGAIGGWAYRHAPLDGYLAADMDATLGLEGALDLPARHLAVGPLLAELHCGRVEPDRYRAQGLGALPDRWRAAGHLRPEADGGGLVLTAAGSWAVGHLVEELLG